MKSTSLRSIRRERGWTSDCNCLVDCGGEAGGVCGGSTSKGNGDVEGEVAIVEGAFDDVDEKEEMDAHVEVDSIEEVDDEKSEGAEEQDEVDAEAR